MANSTKALVKALETALAPRGAKAEFLRKTGMSPSSLAGYLKGENAASIDQLDRIADALGVDPWELLKPPNTPELQKTGPKPVTSPPTSLLGEAVRILAGLDEHELRTVMPYIEAAKEMAATTRLSQNKKLSQDGS